MKGFFAALRMTGFLGAGMVKDGKISRRYAPQNDRVGERTNEWVGKILRPDGLSMTGLFKDGIEREKRSFADAQDDRRGKKDGGWLCMGCLD